MNTPCLPERPVLGYNFVMNCLFPFFLLFFLLAGPIPPAAAGDPDPGCRPTPPDALGPFYRPDAPVRSRVGEGYILAGRALSAGDCRPLPGAAIELWLAGPDGRYDDAHRGTVITGKDGAYRFESNVPPPYAGRPPHIHLRATAPGHQELITQHYPEAGNASGRLDLVLRPAKN